MASLRFIAAGLVLAAAPQLARADDVRVVDHPLADPEHADREGLHLDAAFVWSAIELAIPGFYYWSTKSRQSVDWTLDGSWGSWKKKLTLDTLGFDTNEFSTNAIRHPLTGVGDYQIARSNGFGVVGSELFTFGMAMAWEYLVEYREDQALNDILMNSIGGLAIGEPLYQFGQLWRSQSPSLLDRARTAVFSPFDATQDLVRHHPLLVRPHAWSEFRFASGWRNRQIDDDSRHGETFVSLDADLVNHRDFLRPGARSSRTSAGAWSRVDLAFAFGNPGDDNHVRTVLFHSQTSLGEHYWHDDGATGVHLALGSAFTYHRERLANAWDHGVYAHLLGPQLDVVTGPLRVATAAYADFALIDAHVFLGTDLLPPPLPMYSTVQARGYYDGWGGTVDTRLRLDLAPLRIDAELTGHRTWQIDALDRATVDHLTVTDPMAVPHHIADWRGYGHARIGVENPTWGVALDLGAAVRHGTWHDLERTTYEASAGMALTLGF